MHDHPDSEDQTQLVGAGGVPPRLFKQFRVEGLLGEGGMGRVYRAYDTQLHRPVALKLLSAEVTADAVRKQRFLQEARAAARISHPAIAQIYAADEQDGVAFIAMELVEGRTVRELIETAALDLLGILDLAIQVADGLAKAHELGIVHRDIKPANVMLTPDGHVKILDFGLAKLLDPSETEGGAEAQPQDWTRLTQTQPGMLMGTPAYMSPEQVRGTAVDARSDLFSLGVLLFEMATGRSPFQRQNFMDSLHAVAFDETPPMSPLRAPLPQELQRIISRCLRKQAEERYANARALADELRVVRRDTEAGLVRSTSWRQRLTETWERLRHLPPSRYAWFALGASGLGVGLYLSFSRIGTGGVVFLTVAGVLIYRHIRNRPQHLQELFVRRIARIPEVQLIAIVQRDVTVVVDRPVAQLYGRINQQMNACNQKLYHGTPMTVSILHDVAPDKFQGMLVGRGVHYVRPDTIEVTRAARSHDRTPPPGGHG
jgi:serine/threonine protein kinase